MTAMIKDTILLVGHGSRGQHGNDEIDAFVQTWRKRRPAARIEVCFIEFSDVSLDVGMAQAAQGSERVIVVPLMLGAAVHVKKDIPQHIEKARADFPDVVFVMAKHLGASEQVLQALKSELSKAMLVLDAPDAKNTGVVLLARGSSERVANGEIAKMARWIFEETGHEMVDVAFTGITYPKLETAVQRQVACGMMQVIVLPYYLFAGKLTERISRQVERLRQQYPTIAFASGTYIGFHDAIYGLLDERVADAKGEA